MTKLIATLSLGLMLSACAHHQVQKSATDELGAHENLNATLWVQTAPEFAMLTEQVFRQAHAQLDAALADHNWKAALEQTGDASHLPPAIIVDVDETVLDNSPYQARLVRDDAEYSSASWQAWVQEAAARPIPGAAAFLSAAHERGVKVFFVTNREQEAPTLTNLKAVFNPLIEATDVLVKYERPEWSSDKTTRRAEVAKTHRIIMLFGDDYNDFVSLGDNPDPATRMQRARQHRARWGRTWFVLPNPQYGHFERALWDYDYNATRAEKNQRKREKLKP